jgi:hypothetical protein
LITNSVRAAAWQLASVRQLQKPICKVYLKPLHQGLSGRLRRQLALKLSAKRAKSIGAIEAQR